MFFIFSIMILFSSCQNDFEPVLDEKITLLENIDSNYYLGYQISPVRHGKNTSYIVNRFGPPKGYAVIRTNPEKLIEKNFTLEDSLDISFVEEFAKLKCSYLYFSREFQRMDFYFQRNKISFPPKRTKVILFKGLRPQHQNFISNNKQVKEFRNGWKYLTIKPK